MCLAASCSSCLLPSLLCWLWQGHRHPGEAVGEGLGMSWSSIGPGGIKLRRTWPAGTFWISSKSLSLGGSLARAVGGCAVRFGDRVSLCTTEQGRALTATLSGTGNSAFTHTLIPAQMAHLETRGGCTAQNVPGRSPEVTPSPEGRLE